MPKVQTRRTIKREDHQLILLRVTSRAEFGRPRSATIAYDSDMGIDQSDIPEWVEAWVPVRLVSQTPKPTH